MVPITIVTIIVSPSSALLPSSLHLHCPHHHLHLCNQCLAGFVTAVVISIHLTSSVRVCLIVRGLHVMQLLRLPYVVAAALFPADGTTKGKGGGMVLFSGGCRNLVCMTHTTSV